MRKNIKLVSLMLSFVFCLASMAFGQETNGTIEGTVKDEQGGVVSGVTVTVASKANATGFKRTIVSDNEGTFRFNEVPPGLYTITTSATSGFGAVTIDNIEIQVGRVLTVPVVAKAGGVSATIDVQASDVATVDVRGSEVQTNITQQQIETIPAGVSFTSLLRLAPSTRPETKSGGFQVDGASGAENTFIIDGQDVSNFKTNALDRNNNIPTSLVQEVSVKSSGFDAEFGGATGGVINVVTRGGSNQWRGNFGVEFDAPYFNGDPRRSLRRVSDTVAGKNVAEYVQPAKSGGVDFFPTAQIGGPIIKDRLFFLANYSPQYLSTVQTSQYFTNDISSRRVLSSSERYSAETTYYYGFLRMDANPHDSLRLTGTYLWNPYRVRGIIPDTTSINLGTSAPSAVFNGVTVAGRQFSEQQGGFVPSNNTTAQAIWTPMEKLIITGRFGRNYLNNKAANYFVPNQTQYQCAFVGTGSLGTVTAAQAGCVQGFLNFPTNRTTFFEISEKTNYEVDAAVIVGNFVGNHQIKGGYQRSKIFTDINGGTNGSNVGIGTVQLYYGRPITQGTGPVEGLSATPGAIGYGRINQFGTRATGSNLNQAVYIQDQWNPIRRLTLNLGVRFEKEFIPTFLESLPVQVSYDWSDKIAPRLGFSFDVTGDGKSKIFGSYGKFYDRLKFELPAGSFGGDFFHRTYFEIFPGEQYNSFTLANVLGNFTIPSGGECPVQRAGTRVRCDLDLRVPSLADPDLKPFTQREITFGFEREFGTGYLFTSRYTNKEVLNAVEDAGTFNQFGSEVYNIVNPCKGLHLQSLKAGGITNCVEAERKYNALQLGVERRLTRGFYFNANYTFSRLVGNYSGLASSDEDGRLSPGVNRFFDIPVQGFAVATGRPDNGRLATDRPHVFNFYGSYGFDWFGRKTNETTVSVFTTAQSGTPLTSTVEIFANEVILNGRGDLGRTEMFTQTDLGVQHRYRFGTDERFTMVWNLNIANMFNEKNVLDVHRLTTDTGVDISPENIGFGSTISAINAAITTGVGTQINNYLNANPTLRDPRFGQANTFQGARNVRFGMRLVF